MTRLPPPQQLPIVPRHAKRVRPKTYSVAVYLVVAIVLLQVAMLISVFWLRAMVVSVNVHMPKGQPGSQSTLLIGPTPPKPELPNLPSLPNLNSTAHISPRLTVPTNSDKRERIINLNDEANAFLDQHAVESALDTLLRAEDIDPRYPDTLANLAKTYNLMNDSVHSKLYWQRLVDIGPAVGTIYAVAKDDIQLLNAGHNADTLHATSPFARQVYVDYVEKTPIETMNGQAQFHLRASLARKDPQMLFDQKKLQPYVIFYQQMSDGSLVPDLAQHKGSFDDTFLFWGGKTTEAFGVDYLMPIPGQPGINNAPTGDYYGFIIGIYYNKILQDARSEPADLITRIPLPDEIE